MFQLLLLAVEVQSRGSLGGVWGVLQDRVYAICPWCSDQDGVTVLCCGCFLAVVAVSAYFHLGAEWVGWGVVQSLERRDQQARLAQQAQQAQEHQLQQVILPPHLSSLSSTTCKFPLSEQLLPLAGCAFTQAYDTVGDSKETSVKLSEALLLTLSVYFL